jgi:hypothetical protein
MTKPVQRGPFSTAQTAVPRIPDENQLHVMMRLVETCPLDDAKLRLAMSFLPQVKGFLGKKLENVEFAQTIETMYPLFYKLLTEKKDKA